MEARRRAPSSRGLRYVSAIRVFAGFYAWYRGLAVGGIAKISQLQFAQPVLALGWSVLVLGERVGTTMSSPALLAVVATVALSQRTRHGTTDMPPLAVKD